MTARDRAAASAGRGPLARWTGRRLFRAAGRGDRAAREDVARVAATTGHRLRERARESVALWWARDGEPFLRQAVLENGFVPADPPWRHRVLALLGRLEECGPGDAPWVAELLADADHLVRERAAAFCRDASGAVLPVLWGAPPGPAPGSALRDVLLANRERPASAHLNGLWSEWLASPSEQLDEALLRWGRPATAGAAEALSVIAVETSPDVLNEPRIREAFPTALGYGDHPLYGIAERKFLELGNPDLADEVCAAALNRPSLVLFCRKHRLAPRDEVRRALFFLLTGQPEQHRAMDPDGSLLSLAYASVSHDERERLRKAMLGAGDLDLVRVIVGDDRRGRIPAMSAHEVRYLGEQLAERREWEELWALALDVPIASGVELIRLFDGWVPRDEDSRRVFEMYLETEPAAVTAAIDSLPPGRTPLRRQARLHFRGRVNDVSFAPDGPYLAAAGTRRTVGVFDLHEAALVERYGGFNSSAGRILHLGDGTLVAGERTNSVQRECRLVLCADGAARTLHKGPGSITSLATVNESGGFVAGTRAGALLLGCRDGHVESVPATSLGTGTDWPRTVAAHPASGRLAVLVPGLVLADVADGGSLAALCDPGGSYARVAFVGADSLVCADRYGLVTFLGWSGEGFVRNGGGFVRSREGIVRSDGEFVRNGQAFVQSGEGSFRRVAVDVRELAGLAASPALGGAVVVDRRGDLHVFDATLEWTGVAAAPDWQSPTGLTVSPGGDFAAVSDAEGYTDLFDLRILELPGILRRPPVHLVPRDLGVVGAALADTSMSPEARASLQLLHACLEHRFRFDVQIGDAVRLTAGEHEISL